MGLLDAIGKSIWGAVVSNGRDYYRQKYEEMPLSELKKEWNENFKYRGYSKNDLYHEDSPVAVLDQVYSERTGKKSWLQQYKVKNRVR